MLTSVNAEEPAGTVTLPGCAEMFRLMGETMRLNCVLWDRLPLTPVTRTSAVVSGGAVSVALRITLWLEPGLTRKLAVEAVTPVGSPEKVTWIGALNPLEPVAVIAMEVVALAFTVVTEVPEDRLKSGVVLMVSASVVLSVSDPLEPLI